MPLRPVQQLAIDADVVLIRISLGAEFGHNLSINRDETGRNHLLGFPPGRNPGSGNDFLETL